MAFLGFHDYQNSDARSKIVTSPEKQLIKSGKQLVEV